MSIKKLAISVTSLLLLASASGAFAAEELIITTSSAKTAASQTFAVDIMTEGSAAAIQFNVALPKGIEASQVDLSQCMADLPKTHRGECNVAKGQVIGIAYNDEGVTLPSGLVSIGKIRINGPTHARAGNLKVVSFVASTFDAKELPVNSTIN